MDADSRVTFLDPVLGLETLTAIVLHLVMRIAFSTFLGRAN